jgi:hypothetical protein
MLTILSRDLIISTVAGFDPHFGLLEKAAGRDRLIIHTPSTTDIRGLSFAIIMARDRLRKQPMAVQVVAGQSGDDVVLTIIYDDNLVINV